MMSWSVCLKAENEVDLGDDACSVSVLGSSPRSRGCTGHSLEIDSAIAAGDFMKIGLQQIELGCGAAFLQGMPIMDVDLCGLPPDKAIAKVVLHDGQGT
jgi:hypothetical protein